MVKQSLSLLLLAISVPEIEPEFLLPQGCEVVALVNEPSDVRYFYRDFASEFPVMVMDHYICSLEDESLPALALPCEEPVSDISWRGTNCFYAVGPVIYVCTENGEATPAIEADTDIKSFIVNDNGLLFNLGDRLVAYSYRVETARTLFCSEGTIGKVIGDNSTVFFSSGKNLFILQADALSLILEDEADIISFAVHPNGSIYYAMDTGLYYIDPRYRKIKISDTAVRDMTLVGDSLYLILRNGTSMAITHVSMFMDSVSTSVMR